MNAPHDTSAGASEDPDEVLDVRETLEPTVCESCGVGSRRIDAIRPYRKSFSTRQVFRCDACQLRHTRRWQGRSEIATWVIALSLATFGLFVPGEVGRIGALLLGVALGSIVGLVLHELAHALVARLVGARVWRIELGVGRRVWTGLIRGVRINVRPIPTLGLVVPQLLGFKWRTTRYALILIAGPTINLALAVLALAAPVFLGFPDGSHREQFAFGVFGTNAVMLVGNLWPRNFSSGGVPFRTDGGQLINLLRPSGRRAFLAMIPLVELTERLSRDQFAEVFRLYEAAPPEALAAMETDVSAETLRMVALCGIGRFAESADLAESVASREGLDESVRWTCENNAVYAGIMAGRTERLAEFVERSRAVFEASPSESALTGTHGMALLLSGELDQAEAMLDRARALDEDDEFASSQWAWRAVLADRRDDRVASEAFVLRARETAGLREPEVEAALRYLRRDSH
ncbi:MAG: M50 family metallopeptidase [Planctomycetota bacterium]